MAIWRKLMTIPNSLQLRMSIPIEKLKAELRKTTNIIQIKCGLHNGLTTLRRLPLIGPYFSQIASIVDRSDSKTNSDAVPLLYSYALSCHTSSQEGCHHQKADRRGCGCRGGGAKEEEKETKVVAILEADQTRLVKVRLSAVPFLYGHLPLLLMYQSTTMAVYYGSMSYEIMDIIVTLRLDTKKCAEIVCLSFVHGWWWLLGQRGQS